MQYLYHLLKCLKKGEAKTCYSHDMYISSDEKYMAVDCSGLVDFWLQKEYPLARAEIFDYILQVRDIVKYKITRLYSFDFYDFFQYIKENSSDNWQFVDVEKKLAKGDILAFINPARKGRWGHVAVVEQEISRDDEKIVLKVIDSTTYKHFEDWHQSDDMGIGSGIIELYKDKGKLVKVCYGPNCMRVRDVCAGCLKKMKKNKKKCLII